MNKIIAILILSITLILTKNFISNKKIKYNNLILWIIYSIIIIIFMYLAPYI